MPRRSSSQSHRIKELLDEARATPSPIESEEPTTNISSLSTQPEEDKFDYQLWQQQIWATRLAVPPGSVKSRHGQRAAEKALHYLQQGKLDKALQMRDKGRCNAPISPAQRRQYDYSVFLNNQIC